MNQDYRQFIVDLIKNLTQPIVHENVSVEFVKEGEQWRINLESPNIKKIIGDSKEVISSIQHIVRVIVSKRFPGDRTHFVLDVRNFRQHREQFLKKFISAKAQEEVLSKGISLILLNLTSYERRIAHQMMNETKGLETVSVGSGFERRLIIRPTSDIGSVNMEKAIVIDIDKEIQSYLDKK